MFDALSRQPELRYNHQQEEIRKQNESSEKLQQQLFEFISQQPQSSTEKDKQMTLMLEAMRDGFKTKSEQSVVTSDKPKDMIAMGKSDDAMRSLSIKLLLSQNGLSQNCLFVGLAIGRSRQIHQYR